VGFLDRFQGNKVDPMAEVSANAVAHLREQNLKFQKFMLDKVQDLEEKVAMGQQRLPGPDAAAADFGDIDSIGTDFTDYGMDAETQPAGEEDVRISLEAGVSLTEVAEQPVEEIEPVLEATASAADEPEGTPVEPEGIPEPAPAEEEAGPPNWEDLFGVGATPPGATEAAADMEVETESETPETELEEAEPESAQQSEEAAEPESDATGPAKTAPETAIEAAQSTENVPPAETVLQEVIMPSQESTAVQGSTAAEENTAAQEPRSGGGSLMWDWRSLSAQNTDDVGSEQASANIDAAWEPEAAEEVAPVEDESGQVADGSVEGSLEATVDGTVAEECSDEESQLSAGNEIAAANEKISGEDAEAADTADDSRLAAGNVQALAAMDEDAQDDEEFILLGDTQEQETMVEIPLPDELGEFS